MACSKLPDDVVSEVRRLRERRHEQRLDEQRRIIQSIYCDVVRNVHPVDFILNFLFSKSIISFQRMEKISKKSSTQKKCEKLLTKLLQTKKVEALEAFHEGIKERYPWIARKIENEVDFKSCMTQEDDEHQIHSMEDVQDMLQLLVLENKKLKHERRTEDTGKKEDRYHCNATLSREHRQHFPASAKRMYVGYDKDEEIAAKKPKTEGAKPPVAPSTQKSEKKSNTLIKKVTDRFRKKSKSSQLAKEPHWPDLRRGVSEDLELDRLREALHGRDVEKLQETLAQCECCESLRQNQEVIDAGCLLQKLLAARDELQVSCDGNDAAGIKRLVDAIRQQQDIARFLEAEVADAMDLTHALDPSPARRIAVMKLDKNAVSEVKSCNHPSQTMTKVMTAVFLLLGEQEENLADWKRIQKLCAGRIVSSGLLKRVIDFNVKKVTVISVRRCRELLADIDDDKAQATSAAIYPFYAWVKCVLEDLEATTTKP